MSKRWIKADLNQIQEGLSGKTHIISSDNEEYRIAKSWISNYLNLNDMSKTNYNLVDT